MRISSHTLLGRVHEQVRLEVARDDQALYELIDPVIRARLEARSADEPESTLLTIRKFVAAIRTAQLEEVEILEARKVSEEQGGRSAALVRSIVRYNEEPTPNESRILWVRDRKVWYSTARPRGS
jgi:hypothetical protein